MLKKSYEPKDIEKKWYTFWESKEFFQPKPPFNKPFCIIMPPPNITGVLHMGHALVNTIQDILIRYKRMQGYDALWVPGTDHAGIATQTVVEKHLIKTLNKRKTDFSREEFLEHILQWKKDHEEAIYNQIKKLGCSCDWSRLRFTMDEQCNQTVRILFKKMYDDKLIYRGDYLVNWDTILQTAISDDEVEYEEKSSFLWYFRYPIENSKDYLIIATTRPETMLGDTAIAVNPKDSRYAHLVGQYVQLPLVNRKIPIIADTYVDQEFGTGAVKITPAHDFNDFEIAQRHGLDIINIMTPDGNLNENVPKEFQGLSMDQARLLIIEKIKALNFFEKQKEHIHRVGISYRSKAIIEPYLSKQWFVKVSAFKKDLISVVKDKAIQLIPQNWENTYFHWIENLRDWCISRQLWWGHRIPIWYHKNDSKKVICFDGEGIPPEVMKDPENWVQDEDVLDTWFSSGTWPFSVLGWPKNTPELQSFYPNSVLVTAHDILFFWVARMILMGKYVLNEIPFHTVFLHGLIYGKSYWREKDQHIHYVSSEEKREFDLGALPSHDIFSKWEKMSKSKGNVINPAEIIDEYGTDATRMALTASVTHARQIDLDRRRFEEFKNFTNKIWNGARFIFMNLDESNSLPKLTSENLNKGLDESLLSLEDHWILSLLNKNIELVTKHIEEYHFDKAAQLAYEFYWKEFCSYYLELIKPVLFGKSKELKHRENKQKLLVILLTALIRILHPLAPFITEEIFSLLKERFSHLSLSENIDLYTKDTILALQSPACIVSSYPISLDKRKEKHEEDFAFMQEIIHAIRNIRAEMKIPPTQATSIYIWGDVDQLDWNICVENQHFIEALIRVESIHFEEITNAFGSHSLVGNLNIFVPLPEELKMQEKLRLLKEKEKLEKNFEITKERLSNKDFTSKAPESVVKKMEETLITIQKKLLELKSKI